MSLDFEHIPDPAGGKRKPLFSGNDESSKYSQALRKTVLLLFRLTMAIAFPVTAAVLLIQNLIPLVLIAIVMVGALAHLGFLSWNSTRGWLNAWDIRIARAIFTFGIWGLAYVFLSILGVLLLGAALLF